MKSNLFLLLCQQVLLFHYTWVLLYQIPLSIEQWWAAYNIYSLLGLTLPLQLTSCPSTCIVPQLSIGLLSNTFYVIWLEPLMMAYKFFMSLLLVCMFFLMLIGQRTKTHFHPQVLMLSILVKLLCLGVLKSNDCC